MMQQSATSAYEFDKADRLRRALRVAGVSSNEMADYLGVSRTSVSNWINGHVEPKTQTTRLWALRTGVAFTWLETGQAPAEPGPGESRLWESNPRPSHYE